MTAWLDHPLTTLADVELFVTAPGGSGGLPGMQVAITLDNASAADCTRLQRLLDGYVMDSRVTR